MHTKHLFAIVIAVALILLLDVEVLQKDYPAITGTHTPPAVTSTVSVNNQTSTQDSQRTGVRGSVTLGSVCPVEHNPPDPTCAPRPFGTSIGIYSENVLVNFVKTDDNGNYRIDLPPGVYTFDPAGGNPYPSCRSKIVTVPSVGYATANFSCDSGIR